MSEQIVSYENSKNDKKTAWQPFRHFKIVLPIAIIVILAVALMGLKGIFYKMMIFEAERDAVRISTALIDSDIRQFLNLEMDQENTMFIRQQAIPEIDRHMRSFLSPFDIIKIKVFNDKYKIVYCTDATLTGKVDNDNDNLKKVLKGGIASNYAQKDRFVDLAEEELFNVGVVETYVPIHDADKRIIGSFEIYKDVTEDLVIAKTKLIRAGVVLSVTVLVIFATLIVIVMHAEKTINKRTDEITDTNKALHYEVTKRKHAEVGLKRANDELKMHDNLRNDFIITVSHELRTPLTIFKNILSNLLEGVLGRVKTKQRQNLEVAFNEVDRLAKIIADFLDITTIEAGKMDMQAKPESIKLIMSRVVDFYRPLIQEKSIQIFTLMPEDDIFVNVDSDKITQVIGNLMDNAIKFLPDCGGCITVQITDMKNEVRVDIEDNGIGISTDNHDIEKIFDRFVQVEKQKGEGAHGTGLGLAICKELIELNGGKIWAENLSDGGACFSFVLPKVFEEVFETLPA